MGIGGFVIVLHTIEETMPVKDSTLGPNVVIHHPELVNLYG